METAKAVPITERLRAIKIGSYTVDEGSHSKHFAVRPVCEEAAQFIEQLQQVGRGLSAISKEQANEIERLRQQLATMTAERDELVSNSYKLGTCVKCGNPSQDSTQEHFVEATASEGGSPPEDSRPQRVEAPHHFPQPENMVDRIADILVEDHIALMKELEAVKMERDELVAALSKYGHHIEGCGHGWSCSCGFYAALTKLGADKGEQHE